MPTKKIPLTRGFFAIVDESDYEELSRKKWTYISAGYAGNYFRNNGKVCCIRMHRLLLNAKSFQEVDHINGNGLDNRKENLRICTRAENVRNRGSSKGKLYKGVFKSTAQNSWFSQIMVDGKMIYLGSFDDPKKAAEVYNEAAKKHHGKFAKFNNI